MWSSCVNRNQNKPIKWHPWERELRQQQWGGQPWRSGDVPVPKDNKESETRRKTKVSRNWCKTKLTCPRLARRDLESECLLKKKALKEKQKQKIARQWKWWLKMNLEAFNDRANNERGLLAAAMEAIIWRNLKMDRETDKVWRKREPRKTTWKW